MIFDKKVLENINKDGGDIDIGTKLFFQTQFFVMESNFFLGSYVSIIPDFYLEEFPSETTENWGGEIVDYREDLEGKIYYEVKFDAITLRSYSPQYIEALAREELNVEMYYFHAEHLIHSTQRGTEEEREQALDEIMDIYMAVLDELYNDDEDYEEADDEDFEEAAFFKNSTKIVEKPKPKLKAWVKFAKNATITVAYKDGKQKTGKFKRLEADLDKGLCNLL